MAARMAASEVGWASALPAQPIVNRMAAPVLISSQALEMAARAQYNLMSWENTVTSVESIRRVVARCTINGASVVT